MLQWAAREMPELRVSLLKPSGIGEMTIVRKKPWIHGGGRPGPEQANYIIQV